MWWWYFYRLQVWIYFHEFKNIFFYIQLTPNFFGHPVYGPVNKCIVYLHNLKFMVKASTKKISAFVKTYKTQIILYPRPLKIIFSFFFLFQTKIIHIFAIYSVYHKIINLVQITYFSEMMSTLLKKKIRNNLQCDISISYIINRILILNNWK